LEEELSEAPQTRDPASGDPIRVLIVDDHALFRRGLEMVLDDEDGVEVVGQCGDGQEAVEQVGDLVPDVVLMDIRMPRRGGIEACTAIKDQVPSVKIVMLTISDEEEDLFEAIKAGATGYLLKDVSIDEVADVVRAVHDGQSFISPSMASKLITEFAAMAKRGDERQQQVPAPNREIAKELFISENTVKNHIRNILEKLQLHSRMEAVVYAVREKLLEIS
jgi:two-component system NarL family response regulator